MRHQRINLAVHLGTTNATAACWLDNVHQLVVQLHLVKCSVIRQ